MPSPSLLPGPIQLLLAHDSTMRLLVNLEIVWDAHPELEIEDRDQIEKLVQQRCCEVFAGLWPDEDLQSVVDFLISPAGHTFLRSSLAMQVRVERIIEGAYSAVVYRDFGAQPPPLPSMDVPEA